ncbi:hypothetical protein LSTR_LSTR006484 [Laodelphax striatellus]|uniref:Uncharacterized protein n=1 Tax=Laodelphax striatellus TaxID=195883 RepID=A0A482WX55_LAOST|nr:hypothetical protein LSTR_LSTR006484 [Laodelphax striatellus]
MWVGGIIANFIGKYLSERNYGAWYENRTNGYCVKCDDAKDDPLLPFLNFSMSTCARMYEVISTKASLRRMLFFMFRTMVGRQNTKISKSLNVTMIMLKGSGMTGFMFITYFIANLHPILFGWNELGKYLPAYIAAANKYYSMGDGLGPYLKLILSEEETTEFKSDRLGVLQTVATAIAKAQGQKTAGNIRGNLEAADLPIVNQALEIVQAYGGANKVATDAVRQWDIHHLPNRHLIDQMGQGARAAELENIGGLPEIHEQPANN